MLSLVRPTLLVILSTVALQFCLAADPPRDIDPVKKERDRRIRIMVDEARSRKDFIDLEEKVFSDNMARIKRENKKNIPTGTYQYALSKMKERREEVAKLWQEILILQIEDAYGFALIPVKEEEPKLDAILMELKILRREVADVRGEPAPPTKTPKAPNKPDPASPAAQKGPTEDLGLAQRLRSVQIKRLEDEATGLIGIIDNSEKRIADNIRILRDDPTKHKLNQEDYKIILHQIKSRRDELINTQQEIMRVKIDEAYGFAVVTVKEDEPKLDAILAELKMLRSQVADLRKDKKSP